MNLLKPQYSLRWLFVEMTLTAIAVAFFAYFQRTPSMYPPQDVLFLFSGFFVAAGAAVGGLVHRQVVGGLCGLIVALALWFAAMPIMMV